MPNIVRHHRSFLVIVCTILFLTFLDNTIVSVVLAGVQSTLKASVQELQWIVDGYMLVFAALMLSGGTLGDLFGRKKILLGGVGLFTIGSVISWLAPSSAVLIAGRAVMGIGAAASEPGTLSLIRHEYADRRIRARALGIWAAVSGAALAFGPVIGGVIAGAFSWREIFLFNAVVGVLALAFGWALLPESADPVGRRLDIAGLILGAASLTSATFGIISGESVGYTQWWIIGLFAAAVMLLGLFLWQERRCSDPVLPLSFFRIPPFSGASAVAFATNFGVFAVFFFTTLYLAIVAGFSGYGIALAFVAMAVAMVVAATFTGRWIGLHGSAIPTAVGCILAGGGILWLRAILSPTINTATLAWSLAVIGLGFGITLVTATSLTLNLVPPERSGMAASTFNTFRELGGVFGVAVLGSIVNGQLTGKLASRLQSLGLPHDFQSLAIYGVTHGGNLPPNAHVSPGIILQHPELVSQVRAATYQAFGTGLHIALELAAAFLLAAAIAAAYSMRKSQFPTASSISHEAVPGYAASEVEESAGLPKKDSISSGSSCGTISALIT